MMKNKLIALFLFVAVAVNAAQIKDMSLDCGAKGCALTFKFASDKDLPSFYQKYDAKSHKLSLGFSATSFALGEGIFEIDAASNFVKSMKVYKEPYRGAEFLKIDLMVGSAIATDKNAIALNKSDFMLKLASKGGKSWTLSKLFAERNKAAERPPRRPPSKRRSALPKTRRLLRRLLLKTRSRPRSTRRPPRRPPSKRKSVPPKKRRLRKRLRSNSASVKLPKRRKPKSAPSKRRRRLRRLRRKKRSASPKNRRTWTRPFWKAARFRRSSRT